MKTNKKYKGSNRQADFLFYLTRTYDLYLDRKRDIESSAQQLLTFSAVVVGLLAWFLPTFTSGCDSTQNLLYMPIFVEFKWLFYMAFGSYFVTAVFALCALWITKWIPGPSVTWQDVEDFNIGTFDLNSYEMKAAFAIQQGIEKIKSRNALKYNFLVAGFVCLLIGISCVVIFCVIFLELFIKINAEGLRGSGLCS